MNLYNKSTTDLQLKTNNISKESTTKLEHSQTLFNPELLTKRSVIINTSTSKAMYAFSRAPRFHSVSKDNSTFLYNLPDVANRNGTSIGYGKKTNFVPSTLGRSQNIYNIPREFDLNSGYNGSPKYTFGLSRDACKIPQTRDEKNSPAPNSYNPYKKFGENGLHFSMSFRYGGMGRNYNNPGPGSYKFQQINKEGKYGSSTLRNSTISRFPLAQRFRYSNNLNPGPGAYKDENFGKDNGFVYNSKYTTSLGKTMGKRLANIGEKFITPGPGAYKYFSDFEGFGNFQYKKINKSSSTGTISRNK
jgi:hypothetical protein